MCVVKTASWPVRALTRVQGRWRRLLRRYGIGHRASFLMGFGIIFSAIGFLVVLAPAPPDPFLFHTGFWPWARVLLWCGTGAVAFIAARSRAQWLGFVALTIAPLERVISYTAGAVAVAVTGAPEHRGVTYLVMAGMFGMLFFVVTLCGSWPDPPTDPQQVPRSPGRGAPPWLRRLTRLLQGRTAA